MKALSIPLALAAAAVLAFTARAAAATPASIVTGLDAGWPEVRGFTAQGRQAQQSGPWGEFPMIFSPYPTYQKGVRVAVGDVNGDGRNEIVTAPGNGAFTELRVFDGRSFEQLGTLLPFQDASWWNGAYVSTGDTNADGRAEIVEGLDAGCCTTLHVLDAVSGKDIVGFFPYGDRSEVGAKVAAGDVNGDGKAEILSVPLGSGQVSLFGAGGGPAFRSLTAFGPERSGVTSIAAGDLVGDPRAELVAAAPTVSGAAVKVIDVATGETRNTFYPYSSTAVSSLDVALGDVDGDHRLDIVLSADTPTGTEVKAIDAAGIQLADFYVLDPGIVPGASLALGDLNGDGKAEIVLGGGPTSSPWPPVRNGPDQRVAVYDRAGTQVGAFTAYPGLFQGGVRVALADLNADGWPETVTAPGPGMEPELDVFTQQFVNGRDRGTRLGRFLAFERDFTGGVSVATGDVDGDGRPDIVAGSGPGRPAEVRVFDTDGRRSLSFLPFGPGYDGGISVAAGDLNADGRAEIVVGTLTAPARIRTFRGSAPFGPEVAPFAPGTGGAQVAVADVNGNGRGLVVAGAATGTRPSLALVDPVGGVVVKAVELESSLVSGIRVGAGDLNRDGRDEILVAPGGYGGDSRVRIYDAQLQESDSFDVYDWYGAGMNVAAATRIGFPVAADARTVKLRARVRARIVVARFRDAAGGAGARFSAWIRWGDGTMWNGVVLPRGGGVYDVRSQKRYARAGRYTMTVTLTDEKGRTSIARSSAVVRRR